MGINQITENIQDLDAGKLKKLANLLDRNMSDDKEGYFIFYRLGGYLGKSDDAPEELEKNNSVFKGTCLIAKHYKSGPSDVPLMRAIRKSITDSKKADRLEKQIIELLELPPEQVVTKLNRIISIATHGVRISWDWNGFLWDLANWSNPERNVAVKWAKQWLFTEV